MQMNREAEVDRNFEAFQKVVGSLMSIHAGKHAVLRHGEIVAYSKTAAQALTEGYRRFPDGLFSVQEVADKPLDLGFYSHVASVGTDGK